MEQVTKRYTWFIVDKFRTETEPMLLTVEHTAEHTEADIMPVMLAGYGLQYGVEDPLKLAALWADNEARILNVSPGTVFWYPWEEDRATEIVNTLWEFNRL